MASTRTSSQQSPRTYALSVIATLLLTALIALVLTNPAQATITFADLYTLGKPYDFLTTRVGDYPPVVGGQAVGTGKGYATFDRYHALVWNPWAPSGIDLNPSTFTETEIIGTNGAQHVGTGWGTPTGNQEHAVLWNGNTASVLDLHPLGSGYTTSRAYGTDGTHQVGIVEGTATSYQHHAALWTGSRASYVDLHPTHLDLRVSRAYATRDNQQVGHGIGPATGEVFHALLWTGSASSVVDLHPAGFNFDSESIATNGARQVGKAMYWVPDGAFRRYFTHAMLWSGSAESAIDLHPGGVYTSSRALGISDEFQVGYASLPGSDHAMLWSGSAASAFDLHSLLPSASFKRSYAYSIDTSMLSGTIIHGFGVDNADKLHALAWTLSGDSVLPEPAALSLLCAAACVTMLRRARR
jgi:hypothetical protein